MHKRFNHRVGRDLDIAVDYAGRRIKNRHPIVHQLQALCHAQTGIQVHHFGPGVGAQHLAGLWGLHGNHLLARPMKYPSHIGKVVLAVRILGGEIADVGVQFAHGKCVKPRVDFANFLLLRAGCFLFHDGPHFRALRALADDPAVSGRVLEFGAEQGHGGLLRGVKIAQSLNGFRSDERRVARKNNHLVIGRQCFARDHERVSGAALVRL